MEFITIVWYEAGPLMYAPTGYVWSRSFDTGLDTLNNYVTRGFNAGITRHAVAPTDDDAEINNWIKETLIPVFPTWKTEPEGLPQKSHTARDAGLRPSHSRQANGLVTFAMARSSVTVSLLEDAQ